MQRAAKGSVIEAMGRSSHSTMACDEAMSEADPATRRDLSTTAFRAGEFASPQEIQTWIRRNRFDIDTSIRSCLRSLGDVLVSDSHQRPSLVRTVNEAIADQPLHDALLLSAAQRLLTLGNANQANCVIESIEQGVEREEVAALQRTR